MAALEKFEHALEDSSEDFDVELSEGNEIVILWCKHSQLHWTSTETWILAPSPGHELQNLSLVADCESIFTYQCHLSSGSLQTTWLPHLYDWDKAVSSTCLSPGPECLHNVYLVIDSKSSWTLITILLGFENYLLFLTRLTPLIHFML